ncbi:hypothetical protein [Flavilitoribacter nigricans]|nr:hypothetical protein [Flavilitoribacter nigricans]
MSIPKNLRDLRARVNLRVMYDTARKYGRKVKEKIKRKRKKKKDDGKQ